MKIFLGDYKPALVSLVDFFHLVHIVIIFSTQSVAILIEIAYWNAIEE